MKAAPLQNTAALELANVLARQGHRDQAFRALGLTPYSKLLVPRAGVEAALGEQERAMELLRENGYTPGLAAHHWFSSLWDYPPFQEFIRPTG